MTEKLVPADKKPKGTEKHVYRDPGADIKRPVRIFFTAAEAEERLRKWWEPEGPPPRVGSSKS